MNAPQGPKLQKMSVTINAKRRKVSENVTYYDMISLLSINSISMKATMHEVNVSNYHDVHNVK